MTAKVEEAFNRRYPFRMRPEIVTEFYAGWYSARDEAIKIIESVKLPEAGYDRERWHNAALDRAIEVLK